MGGRPGVLRRLTGEMAGLGEAALAVLVPPLCVACGAHLRCWERWLCGRCSLLVAMSARPREKAVELGPHGSLIASYALDYSPSVSSLVWEMKYGGKPGLAEFLARFLWLGAGDLFCLAVRSRVLVPVPVHPRKRRERGYNQAEVLCRHVSSLSGIPVARRALAKRRDTPSQAGLRREERLGNVAGSFEISDLAAVGGRSVILIDDVVTTGSTLRECAIALVKGGVKDIRACAVASSG